MVLGHEIRSSTVMMAMKKSKRIIEAAVEESRRSGRTWRTVIAGLLLVGSSTAALAADPAAGPKIFKAQCAICHTVVAGENRIGPTLYGVIGRPAGSVPGFNYTADHKKLGITWDAANLDKYLTNPRAMVPDTSMVYAGLKDDTQRADLVAYLETLH
jgi:cytochrome c